MTPLPGWTGWRTLPLRISPAVLAEILDGGQTFRWERGDDGVWTGIAGACAARLTVGADGHLAWSSPGHPYPPAGPALERLLGIGTDFTALADTLPWRSDPALAACLRAYPGLRILRQPFGETLLCFLCSTAKRIVQIKRMAALLAERHGQRLGVRSPDADGTRAPAEFSALPAWDRIARIPEADLRRCGLGFRARHVHATARFIASRPGWLETTEGLPYAEAHERLLQLPGVGAKVADCVLLFGAGRLEAFPVDTWILTAMSRRYGLEGWTPAQVARFGRIHFGPLAGLAQQYLFASERASERTSERGSERKATAGAG